MTVYRDEVFENGEIIFVTIYDTDTSTATVEDHGTVLETRPFTPDEQVRFDGVLGEANAQEIVAESDPAVEKLIEVVEHLNTITAMTNASINSNVAPILKDVVRELKTVARQLNHEVRLTSGRTESTDTGTVMP